MNDIVCASCGKPRKGHNYRHPFVGVVKGSLQDPRKESNRGFVTVKVPKSAREAADKLIARVSSDGWQAIGVQRTDPVSLSSIFEEGIKLLDATQKAK